MMLRVAVIVLAIAAAVIPLPAGAVERLYSTGIYPALQSAVTSISNTVPVALLDIAAVTVIVLAIVLFARRYRTARLRGALVATVGALATGAAVTYLVFLVMWGLNYRRVPLEDKVDYDTGRITRDAALRFGTEAAARLNAGRADALRTPASDRVLAAAFADVQRALGSARTAVPGIPKLSVLNLYFRRAAIDGMTDPFFLEIIVNPDLLPVERPFVLAHEWAHLAGYADESEANFVALLTCARADPMARYSGWLAAYQYVAGSLGRRERALAQLEEGPRGDLRAIRSRYQRSSPAVRTIARDVYDSYLRANRVAEGIGSYDAVLRLMLGSRFEKDWTPRLVPR
jgi:hypothetical protein